MIKIVTDSGSDMTVAEAKEKNISLIMLGLSFGDESCKCETDEDRDIFYEKLRNCKELPKTSQPSPAEYADVYEEAKQAGDEVLVITLSSKLSGTYQSAVIAKDMVGYDKVSVVDSLHVTLTQRMLVYKAVEMRDAGATREEIVQMIEDKKDKIILCGVVDTLEYLKKGGRIPPVLASVGQVLKIKPALILTGGVVEELSKSRGIKQAVSKLYQVFEQEEIDPEWPPYFGFVDDIKPARETMDEMVEKYNLKGAKMFPVGPIIGTHLGPSCRVVSFVRK